MKQLLYIPVVVITCALLCCGTKDEKKLAAHSKDYQWGVYYDEYFPNKKDSAFFLLNRVVNSSQDSIEKADALFRMGRMQLFAGDHYSAQQSFLSSIHALKVTDTAHYYWLAADYNALANAALEVKDYQTAITNYRRAFQYKPSEDNKLYILNNLGVVYQKIGDFKRSLLIFDSAASNHTLDTSIKARIISNFARTKWLADSTYSPLAEFMYALSLRISKYEPVAINASFGYLSDYYLKSRRDSALYYALKRLEVAKTLDDPGERLDALHQLIKIPGHPIQYYSEQYIQLNDSINNARRTDRNQYAIIRYDAAKSKADNLLLEKHIGNQRLVLWSVVLMGFLAIIGILIRARIRRIRTDQETERKIKESQLKTSQKVHDVVANGLYRVMNELEHRDTIDKEFLLNKIERLYERSRDISYEPTRDNRAEHSQPIQELLSSYNSSGINVTISGNEQAFWNQLTPLQKRELQLVLEELMVNMRKHSQAAKVSIDFAQDGDRANVIYTDDGVGLPQEMKAGNGINNTVTRIKSLGGAIIFEKNGVSGLSVSISFPLQYPQT